ncbi:MAG: alginate export family protein [Planctomycetota bacterium]
MIGASLLTAGIGQDPAKPKTDPAKSAAPKPVRLDDALGTPDWLRISGEVRLREEWIDGQFRSATTLDHSDLVLLSRTILRADLDFETVDARVELLDARIFGEGTGSVVDATIVNPIDVLEAFIDIDLGKLGDGSHRLRLGRETVDLGTRRLIARNRYRNTINAFDAIDWEWTGAEGQSLRMFWSLPVKRRPNDAASLRDHEVALDQQDLDQQFYGAYWTTELAEDTSLDVYLFGLDDRGQGVRRRSLWTPGLRVERKRERGQSDYEVEVALQFGESQASGAGPLLDHFAWFARASFGHTMDADWLPRFAVAIDYATGDSDPSDGDNGRFDTLYGARRFDYGPTALWGAVARSNLLSAEFRFESRPSKSVRTMAALRTVWLAAERDTWTTAGVRDQSGAADSHVGEQLEVALDYELMPKNLRIILGGAYLWAGDFQGLAPNGRGRDTAYAFAEMTLSF